MENTGIRRIPAGICNLARCLAQASCCVASCCTALSSSCCAALLSSCCSLTAPPSHCLISPAGCCNASRCTTLSLSSHSTALVVLHWLAVVSHLIALPSCCAPSHPLPVLLLHCPLVVSSHLLVVVLPLVTLPSRHPLTPALSCRLAPAGCCVASCCTTHLSSHCAALLSSCCPLP
jgi:hypothetical protein